MEPLCRQLWSARWSTGVRAISVVSIQNGKGECRKECSSKQGKFGKFVHTNQQNCGKFVSKQIKFFLNVFNFSFSSYKYSQILLSTPPSALKSMTQEWYVCYNRMLLLLQTWMTNATPASPWRTPPGQDQTPNRPMSPSPSKTSPWASRRRQSRRVRCHLAHHRRPSRSTRWVPPWPRRSKFTREGGSLRSKSYTAAVESFLTQVLFLVTDNCAHQQQSPPKLTEAANSPCIEEQCATE